MTTPDSPARRSHWGALRHRDFALYWYSRVFALIGTQIISVGVGWQVYDLTRNPFDLGLVGLVQFTPALLLVLVTGTIADRYSRRMIVAAAVCVEALCGLGLLALTFTGAVTVFKIFAILAVFGVARAFMNPASQSLIPNLVPTKDLASAIALGTISWQTATITGPLAGGLLYGLSAEFAYGTAACLYLFSVVLIIRVRKPPQKDMNEPATWTTVIAGFRFAWKEKVIFGAISLDLFAVLLGGAVALLPAFARDILEVGPLGLGFLRAAPGIGAIIVAAFLTVRPVRDHAGTLMFLTVAMFGVFTTIFGVSTTVWLSVAALALAGAADMISVYIRETLIQVWTPDSLRGRVNAVNMVFVGASNELGEFRAGSVAALIGVVPAVVMGGVGTLAVAGIWAYLFPALRRARYLDRQH
ncbi:MAG: MFS transporter [Alphaproteobacteria bacterium]